MSRERPLQGACYCGRNRYIIVVPEDATENAKVIFDVSGENRRSQATPLTAWLRIPVSWYQSHTQSYYLDETHSAIRRIYTSPHTPHVKRIFCGFCGTHLTYWSEEPSSESEYLQVTVGSLRGEDISALEDLDLLPKDTEIGTVTGGDAAADAKPDGALASTSRNITRTEERGTTEGLSWFEEMISGSALGRSQTTRRGVGTSADGTTRVEWEVTEIHTGDGDEDSGTGRGKRKIGDLGGPGDVPMEG